MLQRKWRIYGLLKRNTRGLTARQISGEIGQPYRTIVRDLDIMSTVLPLYYDEIPGKNGRSRAYRWRIMEEDA